MSKIVLIRHGSTEANEKWLYCGQTDVPLSENGRRALAEKREAGGYPDVTGFRVYTSGMKRTEETLALLFGETEHEAVPELKEISFGDYEMQDYYALEKQPGFLDWLNNSAEQAPPHGESGNEMAERVLGAFRRLADCGGDLLLVVHGGTIVNIMTALFPEEEKGRYDWQPTGGEGYELCYENGRALSYRKIPKR